MCVCGVVSMCEIAPVRNPGCSVRVRVYHIQCGLRARARIHLHASTRMVDGIYGKWARERARAHSQFVLHAGKSMRVTICSSNMCICIQSWWVCALTHTHTMSAQICARAWNNCINNNNNKHVFLPASRQLIVRPQQYYSSVTVLCGLHMCGCVGGLHV